MLIFIYFLEHFIQLIVIPHMFTLNSIACTAPKERVAMERLLLLLLGFLTLTAGAQETLTIETAETAGISGFRKYWDKPVLLRADGATKLRDHGRFGKGPVSDWSTGKPGALVFDAVHRSLLVRFPGSAEKIAAALQQGKTIEKVELVLEFVDTEYFPEDYMTPAGMSFLGDLWVKVKPEWHAVAWPLRRPWKADAAAGPTWNANVNGKCYWTKYGAQDEQTDRYPAQLGPAEVSHRRTSGRLDVTQVLTAPAYGKSPGARLRAFESNGLLVKKWELYDCKYWWGQKRNAASGYEWGVATGQRGIRIKTPKLVVTFKEGQAGDLTLPAAVDVTALPRRGKPTAVDPTDAQIQQYLREYGFQQPDWMPDWQWHRCRELHRIQPGQGFPGSVAAYRKWLDAMLSMAPRRWSGFDAGQNSQMVLTYRNAIPAPVIDHWKLYWQAWLMPHMKIKDMAHGYIGGRQARAFYDKTGDWRGNFSVYRTYCHSMGTMNFNHWATAGTLFGGVLMEDEFIISEGRHGLEHWPLRTWSWYDGSTQESIDHYYFAHSLSPQKVFADLGPTQMDRMMGRSITAKSIEELTSCYHPALKRFISQSGRTGISYVMVKQDGLSYIVHTLSKKGALLDLGKTKTAGGIPLFGSAIKPGQIALQALNAPWAPAYTANMVDQKPLPYEMTVAYMQWGHHRGSPLLRRSYLGQNYGLASQDAVKNETVPFMAMWRHSEAEVKSYKQLTTLIGRFGINRTELLDSVWHDSKTRNPNGSVGRQGGSTYTVQHKNKMIVLASPLKGLKVSSRKKPRTVTSLQMTLGLMNWEPTRTWTIYVDGKRQTGLPIKSKMTQKITIDHGAAFIALIPIPATDLGREEEIVIADSGKMTDMQGGGKAKEALRIDQYFFKPMAEMRDKLDMSKVDGAVGGFIIEVADKHDFPTFAAFQKHIAATKLKLTWKTRDKKRLLDLDYTSGRDTMAITFDPLKDGRTNEIFLKREVNGKWPYLPKGVLRDSTLTIQGTTGRLSKNGAELVCEPGRMAYIQTEPVSGTYVGFNPFPKRTLWRFAAPGGITVSADGRVGITRATIRPQANAVEIEHAAYKRQSPAFTDATAFVITGTKTKPAVRFNGKEIRPRELIIAGRTSWLVPLVGNVKATDLPRRYTTVQEILDDPQPHGIAATGIRHWYICGPFRKTDANFATAFGPEQAAFSVKASFKGINGKSVKWQKTTAKKGIVEFWKLPKPHQNVCAYATAVVNSDADRTVSLLAGSDDTIQIWVNGKQVHANKAYRGVDPESDFVPGVPLKKGRNEILVKICQGTGGWGMCLRLADAWGRPIDGVTEAAPK